MTKTIISIDFDKKITEQIMPLHNRWHPDIPAVVEVEPNAHFRVECVDWTGGQIKNNDDALDIQNVDLNQVHYMSGPIAIKGAQPGDLLAVDILDIGTLPQSAWGFTGIFDKKNGGGFLTDFYPHAAKAIWNFDGIYATSRHIHDVRIAGLLHTGLIGVAPSHDLLEIWNSREQQLINTDPYRIPPLAHAPNATGALCGKLTGAHQQTVASTGARTVPPRENGGNCDIKNLTRGSRIFFPVYVQGAHLSVGDIHFSQGDGEISFCGGIEMSGWVELRVNIIKNGMQTYGVTSPIFHTSPLEPHYSSYITFEGISVDEQGKQYYLDAHIAYRRAALNAIEYLKKFGYTGEQAYMLLSTIPVEGRLSGIVDIPNACATIAIPTEIFNFDIQPNTQGPLSKTRGALALIG